MSAVVSYFHHNHFPGGVSLCIWHLSNFRETQWTNLTEEIWKGGKRMKLALVCSCLLLLLPLGFTCFCLYVLFFNTFSIFFSLAHISLTFCAVCTLSFSALNSFPLFYFLICPQRDCDFKPITRIHGIYSDIYLAVSRSFSPQIRNQYNDFV